MLPEQFFYASNRWHVCSFIFHCLSFLMFLDHWARCWILVISQPCSLVWVSFLGIGRFGITIFSFGNSNKQDYYSTFHKTPKQKKFTKKQREDFTRESTHQAVAQWGASPEVTNWIIKNADRIQLFQVIIAQKKWWKVNQTPFSLFNRRWLDQRNHGSNQGSGI
jgi:hypothetical protein